MSLSSKTFNSPRIGVFAIVVFLLTFGSAQASTITIVTARANLNANQSLDWSEFGPAGTGITPGATLTTPSGLIVTVTQPYYGLQIRQEIPPAVPSGGWYGDFLPSEFLLTNWNSPFPVTLLFSQPVYGAGVQIEPGQVDDLPAAFSAFITAYDGSTVVGQFSTTGIRSRSHDGSSPFLGVMSDSAEITSITYRVVAYSNGPNKGDLGMNFFSLRTTPVPEAGSLQLVIGGIGILVGIVRRRTV